MKEEEIKERIKEILDEAHSRFKLPEQDWDFEFYIIDRLTDYDDVEDVQWDVGFRNCYFTVIMKDGRKYEVDYESYEIEEARE